METACDASLKELNTEYLDLYLMHWPFAFKRGPSIFPKGDDGKVIAGETGYIETWKAMERLVKIGKCRSIGVSNFSRAELELLLEHCDIPPATHQIENHPYLAQLNFHDFHKNKGIHITQYSPLGNQNARYDSNVGKLVDDPVLLTVGQKYGKSGAQVALAWGIAKGHDVIPKSKTPARIRENLEADFAMDGNDVEKIDQLDKKLRFSDPSERFGREFFSDLDGKTCK